MEFRILGPLEVSEAGRSLPLGGSKQRALLALLLLSPNEPVSIDGLIEDIWTEQPPRGRQEEPAGARFAAAQGAARARARC